MTSQNTYSTLQTELEKLSCEKSIVWGNSTFARDTTTRVQNCRI